MREIVLFIFLITLVACPYPGSTEKDYEPTKKENEKKLNLEIKECVLKKEISKEFKALMEKYPEENLRKLIYLNRDELTREDKQIYSECRKEKHLKFMEKYKTKRYYRLIEKGYRAPDPNENHEPIE